MIKEFYELFKVFLKKSDECNLYTMIGSNLEDNMKNLYLIVLFRLLHEDVQTANLALKLFREIKSDRDGLYEKSVQLYKEYSRLYMKIIEILPTVRGLSSNSEKINKALDYISLTIINDKHNQEFVKKFLNT